MSLEIRIDAYTPTRNEQLRVKVEITKGWICLGDRICLPSPNGKPLWGRVRRLVLQDRFAFAAITGDRMHMHFEPLKEALVCRSDHLPLDLPVDPV